jgi:DnaJ-class molecular chaperone
MQLTPACSRCGGSGHYSFNGQHSICYRCNGDKVDPVSDKNISSVIAAAKRANAEGKVDDYIEALKAKKASKGAFDHIMAAWHNSTIAKINPHHFKRDPECNEVELKARTLNAQIAAEWDRLQKLNDNVLYNSKATPADQIAFSKAVEECLRSITAWDEELKKML